MQKSADNYAQGLSDSASEVSEPMRILMQENSRALDSISLGTHNGQFQISGVSFPKIRSGRISRCEGESDHHPM